MDSKEGVGAGDNDMDGLLLRSAVPVPPVADPETGGKDEEGVEGVAMLIVGGGMIFFWPGPDAARFIEDGLSYISVNLFNFSNASSYIRSSLALRSPTVGSRRTVSIKLCHSCVLAAVGYIDSGSEAVIVDS